MAYTKYSLTPANNNATPPDGAPEGMLPSAVNDTMRDMMAQIRDVGDGIRDGTYTMTAPKITGGTITGAAFTGNTFTNPVITGGSINNTPIGATTSNSGAFTTLSASGVATFSAGTVSAPALTTTGDTNTGIFFPAADTIAFTEGGVESMRIDSSGNVGIGTSSPGSRIHVVGNGFFSSSGSTELNLSTTSATTTTPHIIGALSNSGFDYANLILSSNTTRFNISGSERMRIDSSGNVGIGVTPSAWASANNGVIQMQRASIAGLSTNDLHASSNAYYDNTNWRYIASSVAVANYYQSAGTHVWRYAAAGTAGNTISWSEAMRIDSSGNVGIGLTAPAYALDVLTNAALSNATGAQKNLYFRQTNLSQPNVGSIGSIDDGNFSGHMNFFTKIPGATGSALAERMRITSGGRLLVGTTSENTSGGVLQVSNGITFPATQSASSDANTLDDYEEGTFTPVLTYQTPGTLSVGYTQQYGRYTKIGRLVYVQIFIQLNAFSKGTASGALRITGLPFTSESANDQMLVWSAYDTPLTTTAGVFPMAAVNSGTTIVTLYEQSNNNTTNPNWSDPDGNAQYKVSGCYQVST